MREEIVFTEKWLLAHKRALGLCLGSVELCMKNRIKLGNGLFTVFRPRVRFQKWLCLGNTYTGSKNTYLCVRQIYRETDIRSVGNFMTKRHHLY